MLAIYRTHSQTLGLFREVVDKNGSHWVIVEVGHVHDEKKIKEWQRKGATAYFSHTSRREAK